MHPESLTGAHQRMEKTGIIKGGSAIDLFLSRERGKSKKNKRDGGWYANKWKARRKDRH